MSFKKEDKYIKSLTLDQRETRKRILEISHKLHLSHIGSCFSAVDLIDAVYKAKKNDEKFILSNGHAGVALYVILEKFGLIKNPKFFEKLHVHPDRNPKYGIPVSTGSLGQGLPIALGIALASRDKNVYCMISDGECAEGSIWESLRLADELKVNNLKIILNANGWGAYGPISLPALVRKIKSFDHHLVTVDGHNIREVTGVLKKKIKNRPVLIFAKTTVSQLPFLKGQDAHYYIMNEEDYLLAKDLLERS